MVAVVALVTVCDGITFQQRVQLFRAFHRDRILLASRYIPVTSLGTTDDCGFSPFADDASTSRDIAFAKIRARVEGTALAASQLALS